MGYTEPGSPAAAAGLVRGDEVLVSTSRGAATISPVAVALAEDGIEVRELTLRTPTLDDVFLELTGGHLSNDGSHA